MATPHIVDPAAVLSQALGQASVDLMRSLLQTVINALLSAECCTPHRTSSKPGPVRNRTLAHIQQGPRLGKTGVLPPRTEWMESPPVSRDASTGRTSSSNRLYDRAKWSAEELAVLAARSGVSIDDLMPTPDGNGGWVPAPFKPGWHAPALSAVRVGALVPQVGLEPTTGGL